MKKLISEIRACTICRKHLPFKPRPMVQASGQSKIVIIGQAPGLKVQQSGIPWDDASGKELRRWLDVSDDQFYNERLFSLMPMGFCYPGKGSTGDLQPRPECAPQWHEQMLDEMKKIQLVILIGQFSQKYYLKERSKTSITENVRGYKSFLPDYFPLVHPSPRNRIWQKKNPWFEKEVVVALRQIVKKIIA